MAKALKGLFGTAEERKSIDWAALKAQDKELCAIHPLLDLSRTATIPDGETILEMMRDVMDYWFDERIECDREDGKKIAVLPLKGKWHIGAPSGRGLIKERPAKCHPKMVELVFWSRETVQADETMRSEVPEDLLANIEWWFVGIDPIADGVEYDYGKPKQEPQP